MNIEQIEAALKNEDASPPDLAKFSTILAGYYSYYGQMLKRIQLIKPKSWLDIQRRPTVPLMTEFPTDVLPNGTVVTEQREVPPYKPAKPHSDKKTEMIWATTEDGQKEIALEWELKRIEKMMSAINKRLYVDNIAVKNQY